MSEENYSEFDENETQTNNQERKVKFVAPTGPGKYNPKPSFTRPVSARGQGKPVQPPLKMSISEGINMASDFIEKGAEFVEEAGGTFEAVKDFGEKVVGAVEGVKVIKETINQFSGGGGKSTKVETGGIGSGGDGDNSSGRSNSGFHPYHLDYNEKPLEIKLSTNIKPNTYSPLYHNSIYRYYNPLHFTGAKFALPDVTTQLLYDWFNKVLMFDLKNRAQGAITFSLPSGFTSANISAAFDTLIDALQVYYYFDSILMYANNPMNRNDAMLTLREQITAEHINKLYSLRRVLIGTPIPPNLNTMLYYLMQTYSSSSLPGASLIKINPIPFTQGTLTMPAASVIQSSIDALTDTTTANGPAFIFSILARACPNWMSGKMYVGSASPLHDENFTTIWTNLPYWHTSSVTGDVYSKVGPICATNTTPISYNSYTNELDGAAFALVSANNGSNGYIPSLILPVYTTTVYVDATHTTEANRLSFSNIDGTPKLNDVYKDHWSAMMRNDTYIANNVYNSTNVTNISQFGSEVCLGVYPDTITQTAYQVVEWMLSLGSIPKRKDRGGNNNKGGRKGKGYPKK